MWQYQNTVLIYISDEFQYKPSVAACGLIRTIIKKTGKGATEEWNIANDTYMKKFKTIHDSGGSIVFISNQMDTLHINTIKSRFNKFIEKFTYVEETTEDKNQDIPNTQTKHIPVMAIFSTKKNCFTKPFTNLWKVMGFMYQIKKLPPPDLKMSIYIGRCDGGIYVANKGTESNVYTKKFFKCRTDIDRAFAHNVGVQFVSQTQFFYDKPEPKWKWCPILMDPDTRMKYIKDHKNDTEPNMADIINEKKYLIIIMGMPSSGRSTLIKRIVDDTFDKTKDANEPHIIHITKTKHMYKTYSKKLTKCIHDAIYEKTTIIKLDYSDYKHRNILIAIAREYEVPVLIINLTTDINICKILNYTKVQTSSNFNLGVHSRTTYAEWEKQYEVPIYYPDSDKDITVIEYPMVLRFRKELKFHYSPI